MVASYYPRKSTSIEDMVRSLREHSGLSSWNDFNEDRRENILIANMRGKGAPIKIRTKEEAGKGKKKGKK